MSEPYPGPPLREIDEVLVIRDRTHDLEPRFLSTYEIYDDRIVINDENWNTIIIGEEPGDEVFLELVTHPLVRRLHSIAQLTLPMTMETVPGIYTNDASDGFTRWHHAFGSLAFVRLKGHELGIEPRLLRRLELTAFLSDITQWAGSHLGDFMFQGFGGPEDAHDLAQEETLVKLEFDKVLEKYGFTLEEVLLKNLPPGFDWVETDSPDLSTDRVDYGAKQIGRHLDFTMDTHNAIKPDAFFVDPETGRLIMKDERHARAFTKAFLLLATESWQEPVHRLNLYLFSELVKRMLIAERPLVMHPLMGIDWYNPRDYMLTIDADLITNLFVADSFTWAARDIAEDLARQKRRIYQTVRRQELEHFLNDDNATQMPDPLVATTWQGEVHSLLPSNVEMLVINDVSEVPDYKNNPLTVDIPLPSLKPRFVDPLYMDSSGNIVRLSQQDDRIRQLIEHQQALLRRTYLARLLVNADFKRHIETGLSEIEQMWPETMSLARMPDNLFRAALRESANYGVVFRQARIAWNR